MTQNLRFAFLFFALTVFIGGCKKDDPNTNNNNNNNHQVPTSGYYFQGTFGGTFNQITSGAGGASSSGYSGNAGQDFNYDGGGAYVNYANLSNLVTMASINIHHYYYNNDGSDVATYASLFAVSSSVPFEAAGNNPGNGVYITWVDANGHTWASNNAPGTQNGSKFSIATCSAVDANTYMITFSGTFNCILYDSLGNSKVVTDGAYKSYALLQ